MLSFEEMSEAMPDFLRLRAHLPTGPESHPMAHRMIGTSLRDIQAAASSAAGYGTGDFGEVLGNAARELIVQTYTGAADHRAFCRPIGVKKLSAVDMPVADLVQDLPPLTEMRELQQVSAMQGSGERAQLRTYGGRLIITRETTVNDDVGLVVSMSGALGVSTAATEAMLVYALLESNPNLRDGDPWFHADYGNLLTGHALSDLNLAAAMAALRNQPTPAGNLSNQAARFLVVAPELEAVALGLVRGITIGAIAPLQVIAAPWLAAGRWYMLADPVLAPTVGRLYLDHAQRGDAVDDDAPVIVKQSSSHDIDGVVLAVVADLGATPLSRVGVVRCEA